MGVMSTAQPQDPEKTRVLLGLLESLNRDGGQTQRKLAAELGVALGLVNGYLRRCVSKGLLKMSQVPTRRYAYYLTPSGFAEKSRLTVEYLSSSFSFFRRARAECSDLLMAARQRGYQRIALLGVSDLAEIATICALETGMTIVAVVDARSELTRYFGCAVVKSLEEVGEFDAALVTDLLAAQEVVAAATEALGANRVLIPELLGVRSRASAELVS